MQFEPAYLRLYRSGELAERVAQAKAILKKCVLCPRCCQVDRTRGEKGFCRSGAEPIVSSFNPHFGEEPVLVGSGGSGTIFFTNCTLACIYCQNYPISQLGNGNVYTTQELARMYLRLQRIGCHNINFVTPTHFVPQILEALELAIPEGFNLPLVYNTSGYERVETLRLLDGIFDIYMPDIKYASNEMAQKYSGVSDYVEYNRSALKEMYRQVGILQCDEQGIAQRGLLVRHLVLPENISGSEDCIRFLAEELSPHIHLALMSQYFPAYKAPETPPLNQRIDRKHFLNLARMVKQIGF
ncbi:radical SAM protein [Candidatus Sumerlaeota bacterium]|nr:radical SAM protein [Candidatus Sumerlaeota bacterium]